MKIVHEDPEFVVVVKPGGLLSVPGRGPDKQDCLISRLRLRYPAMIGQPAVHRLDMYTSGLMVVAITDRANRQLNRQFADRLVSKRYTALLEGRLEGTSGEIRLPFRLDADHRPLQIYDPEHGKLGITRWRLITQVPAKPQGRGEGASDTYSRVRFTPLTGRTHQLRVHAAHPMGLGLPIVGDSLYGNGNDGDPMLLHADELAFHHPLTGKWLTFSSPPSF